MQFDNIMKKLILFAALSVATMCFAASAANARVSDPVLYRSAGYKGSVSLTDITLAWVGLETSHGYMFNEHHYLGAGAGVFIAPTGFFPLFGHAFVDYNAYILKRASTPIAGIKIGYMTFLGELDGVDGSVPWHAENSIELEPNIGWSWAFNENLGIRLSLGAAVFIMPQPKDVLAMPKLAIAFDF